MRRLIRARKETVVKPSLHPPAFLPDFRRGLARQWSGAVSDWLDAAVDQQRGMFHKSYVRKPGVQFFNPVTQPVKGNLLEQPVVWNAFPKDLVRKLGFPGALRVADELVALSQLSSAARDLKGLCRQGSEYCEWRVTRNSKSGKIQKVVFTSEPPEYWRAMFGGSISFSPTQPESVFKGDPDIVLQLYKHFVSDKVKPDDLLAPEDMIANGFLTPIRKGEYNPFNKWNTTDGIVHLTHPSNSILAEINLAAAATILRKDNRNRILVEPEELICCAGFGSPNRNSDPTIGGIVNALARHGCRISLKDPIGVYIDHIDLAGWAAPKGDDVHEFVRITRGEPGMISRLEIEVPPGKNFRVGDLTIGGVPISHGGQVAECITMKLTAVATKPRSVQNPMALTCSNVCYVTDTEPLELITAAAIPAGGHFVSFPLSQQEPHPNQAHHRQKSADPPGARQIGRA
jgi:hypothetical protein